MVEMKITHTIMNSEDLRNLCIKSEWFDIATNSEYEKFLKYANKPAEPSILLDMAKLVYEYTDSYKYSGDKAEGLNSIVWTIYRYGVNHSASII